MNKLLVLILMPILSYSQNYLWPTNASKFLTSSFCEYRPGHYHSAIDIKTWNTEGYRIYAIEDGLVERVRVSPFGYGKVIYLKLNDGRTAVYAHLQRFNKKLDAELLDKQFERERYSISWKPENWPVKKGDILGYTGQTGIGVPHLHFEIRDDKEQPLNPLHFYNVIKDHVRPTLQSILVIPMDENSLVNGVFGRKKIELRAISNGNYVLKKPMSARGKIGLALRGYDKADKIYNRFAFYSTQLELDGKKIFHIQYDTLNFNLSRQIDVEIDYPEYQETKQVYHKLFIEPYNELLFYDRDLGDGVLDVQKDTLAFKIRVTDFDGNTSTISGSILPDFDDLIKVGFAKQIENYVFFELMLPKKLNDLHFFGEDSNHAQQLIDYYEILKQTPIGQHQIMWIKLRLDSLAASAINITVTLPNNLHKSYLYSLIPTKPRPADITFENHSKYLTISPDPALPNAQFQIRSGDHFIDYPMLHQAQEIVLPAKKIMSDTLHIKYELDTKTLSDTTLVVHKLLPEQSQTFSFYNDMIRLYSDSGTVFDTLLFQTDVDTSLQNPGGKILLSPAFKINGTRQILRGKLGLKFSIDSSLVPGNRMGICGIKRDGSLSWMSTRWDTVSNLFSTRVSSFGSFVLAADTVAPSLEIIYPSEYDSGSGQPKIEFIAEDTLSGIGSDRNISIWIDGSFVLPEWDPETHRVHGILRNKLSPGSHLLFIKVSDQAGNISEKQTTFTVTEGKK